MNKETEKPIIYGALLINLGNGLSRVIKEDSEVKRQKEIEINRLAGYGCLNRWNE